MCEEHFPEPIIFNADKPMCKKCIPEFVAKQNKSKGGVALTQQ